MASGKALVFGAGTMGTDGPGRFRIATFDTLSGMVPAAKSELVSSLEQSSQEFRAAVSGLSELQAKANPQAGRWSVLECVEHVVTVEERLLGRLEAAECLEKPIATKWTVADLAVRVPNRANPVQAPEAVRPTGRFGSLAQALDQFDAVRARTIKFAQDREPDLYLVICEHPLFGVVDGAGMLAIISGHARRHTSQIREIRSLHP